MRGAGAKARSSTDAGAPGPGVVVIGGGAAGALTAVALLRNDPNVTVQVVERAGGRSRGIEWLPLLPTRSTDSVGTEDWKSAFPIRSTESSMTS